MKYNDLAKLAEKIANLESKTYYDILKTMEEEYQNTYKANYFVCMTDKFMSGWGRAESKTNKLIIGCSTYEQAKKIYENAKKRDEMIYVNINTSFPRYGKNHYVSYKVYDEMGEIWTK